MGHDDAKNKKDKVKRSQKKRTGQVYLGFFFLLLIIHFNLF